MTNVINVRVTKKSMGRTLESLETLWYLRDLAHRRLSEHIQGLHLTADEWAAVNTPDEAWEIEDESKRPSAEWKKFKDEWHEEAGQLAEIAWLSRRHVRIATGHEPIGKMVCRP